MLLQECLVAIQIFVFKMKTTFFTQNYLIDDR